MTNLASADKDLVKKRHSELIENVKNVQGYNRGAERGFTAIYPDCIHVLTNSVSVPELATWFRKVINNIKSGHFVIIKLLKAQGAWPPKLARVAQRKKKFNKF